MFYIEKTVADFYVSPPFGHLAVLHLLVMMHLLHLGGYSFKKLFAAAAPGVLLKPSLSALRPDCPRAPSVDQCCVGEAELRTVLFYLTHCYELAEKQSKTKIFKITAEMQVGINTLIHTLIQTYKCPVPSHRCSQCCLHRRNRSITLRG